MKKVLEFITLYIRLVIFSFGIPRGISDKIENIVDSILKFNDHDITNFISNYIVKTEEILIDDVKQCNIINIINDSNYDDIDNNVYEVHWIFNFKEQKCVMPVDDNTGTLVKLCVDKNYEYNDTYELINYIIEIYNKFRNNDMLIRFISATTIIWMWFSGAFTSTICIMGDNHNLVLSIIYTLVLLFTYVNIYMNQRIKLINDIITICRYCESIHFPNANLYDSITYLRKVKNGSIRLYLHYNKID